MTEETQRTKKFLKETFLFILNKVLTTTAYVYTAASFFKKILSVRVHTIKTRCVQSVYRVV